MKHQTQFTIYASEVSNGLDIYMNVSGIDYYLTSRRRNGLLWLMLKDGKTLSELERIRPRHGRTAQKQYHYASYIVKLAHAFVSDRTA